MNNIQIKNKEIFLFINHYRIVKDINNILHYVSPDDIRIINGELIRKNKKWKIDKPRNNLGLNNSIGGKIGITNIITNKRKYIKPCYLNNYLNNGWVNGWVKKNFK